MKLLERFAAKASEQRQTASEKYRAILDRADEPAEGDEYKLGEVMAELGLTQIDVASHLRARRDVERLAASVQTEDALDALDSEFTTKNAATIAFIRKMLKTFIDRLEPEQLAGAWNWLSGATGVSMSDDVEIKRDSMMKADYEAKLHAESVRRDSVAAEAQIRQLKAANAVAFA